MAVNIKDLRLLVEVARTKSISKAARNMHISQQGVSHTIRKIEKTLNITLFNRFTKGVYLTEAGEKVVELTEEILLKYDQLLNNINCWRENSETGGVLAIYNTFHSGVTILPKALDIFKFKFPEVKLSINEKSPYEIVDIIKEGDGSAIGLINMPRSYYDDPEVLARFNNDEICFRKVFQDQLVACIAKSSPLAMGKLTTIEDFVKHEYPLVYYDVAQYNEIVSILFRDYGQPVSLLKTLNTELYRKVIVDGLAFGFATLFELSQHRNFADKVTILPTELTLVYGWVYSARHPVSPAALKFIRCLEMSLK